MASHLPSIVRPYARPIERAVTHAMRRVTDPFGFYPALDGLQLQAEDLPGIRREQRLEGSGL